MAAVDAAGVANMVWYNYRRVPAVTLAKQLIDEGRLEESSTTAQIPAGLDDIERSSAGRRRRCGDWMRAWREAASQAICSRTISIRLFG